MSFQKGDWISFNHKSIQYHGIIMKKYNNSNKQNKYVVCIADGNGVYYRISTDKLTLVKLNTQQKFTILLSFGKKWWSENKLLFKTALTDKI
jgi:hypothetical protein